MVVNGAIDGHGNFLNDGVIMDPEDNQYLADAEHITV
jgi:hypothetical protein